MKEPLLINKYSYGSVDKTVYINTHDKLEKQLISDNINIDVTILDDISQCNIICLIIQDTCAIKLNNKINNIVKNKQSQSIFILRLVKEFQLFEYIKISGNKECGLYNNVNDKIYYNICFVK